MLGQYKKSLRQPYPLIQETSRKWKVVFGNGILVSLFLFVFRPFGLSSYSEIFVLGYGLVTIAVLVIAVFVIPVLIPFWFKEKKWTVGRNILYVSFLVFFIGLGNLWYTHILTGAELTIRSLIHFQFFTLAVTFFIAATLTFIQYNFLSKRNEKEASIIQYEMERKPQDNFNPTALVDQEFTIKPENEREEIKVSLKSLLYIESADNYSTIVFEENQLIKKVLIRSTLKRIEEQLSHFSFFRCHRSYIVNLTKVTSVKGNSQGYQLELANGSDQVPVSRKYGTELNERLKRSQIIN